MNVAVERSGWRDQELSARHRMWGWDNPMVDVDWLVIEYDNARAVALIDYKESGSPRVGDPKDHSTRAFAGVASDARRPAFTVRYHRPGEHWPEKGWEFFVIPLNDLAREAMPHTPRLDEVSFVTWLYALRGRDLPEDVRERILLSGAKRRAELVT